MLTGDSSTSRMICIFSLMTVTHISPQLHSSPFKLFFSTRFFRLNSATSCFKLVIFPAKLSYFIAVRFSNRIPLEPAFACL